MPSSCCSRWPTTTRPCRRPPRSPGVWPTQADYDIASLDALSLATFISRTFGEDALLDLVARATLVDAGRQTQELDRAYSEALGADQAALVEDWTQWAEELAQEGEPQVQEGR